MKVIYVLSVLLLVGCGAREEVVVSQLSLSHRGWDTLAVDVSFASKTVLGGTQPAREDTMRIVAFNASYDTLYAGTDVVFAVKDTDLGNEERILVEVCGELKALRVCEQAITRSSTKRVMLEPDITYPLRKKVFEGEYKLPFVIERLEDSTWTPIKPTELLQGYMKAYVNGKAEEAIQLPFSKQRGGFNLAYKNNYKNFKFYLDSALLDEKAATVIFDVYVDLEGFSEPVGSVAKDIALKSEEEHKQDIAQFVEQAADRLVEHLSPFLRRKKNVVYIDRWTYNTFKKMYSVEMEVEWKGMMFNRRTYRLSGVLEVYEEGDRATFRYIEGNRLARQRWNSRVDGEMLDLLPTEDGNAGDNFIRQKGAFQEDKGLLVMEAEHFETSRTYNSQTWSISNDHTGYRGEGAVVVAPDKGVRIRSRYNKRSPELTYPVRFSDSGTYYVWLRVWAKDDNSNSVHLGINGSANRSSSYIGTEKYGQWIWTRMQLDRDDYASVQISSPGLKKVNLWMREDGLYVDRILLTKDRHYAPEGTGPAESLR